MSKPDKKSTDSNAYASWTEPDGGKDGMTPVGRLTYFFTKNAGEMLEDYLGKSETGRATKRTKTSVLNLCSQHFEDQGVKRNAGQIKSKIENILKKYKVAYDVWGQSGEGAIGDNASPNGRIEFESKWLKKSTITAPINFFLADNVDPRILRRSLYDLQH